MNLFRRFPDCILLTALLLFHLPGQAGKLHILFQDAQSGAPVIPSSILFDGVDITTEAAGNALARDVPDGNHQIEVRAVGYSTLSSTITSVGAQTLANIMSLDRSPENATPTPDVQQDEFVISGHVLDEEASELLPDVEVYVQGFQVRQKSGKDGRFSITVNLKTQMATTTATEIRGNLIAEKAGYRTEEKQGLILVPGSSMQTQLSLQKASPGEEGQKRVRREDRRSQTLSTWVYQVGLD